MWAISPNVIRGNISQWGQSHELHRGVVKHIRLKENSEDNMTYVVRFRLRHAFISMLIKPTLNK